MQQELTGIAGWAVDVMETLGGFGAFLLISLENLFPPLPSEIILSQIRLVEKTLSVSA